MKKYITISLLIALQLPVINNNASITLPVDNHDISYSILKTFTTDFLTRYQTEATNAAFGGFIAKNSIVFPSPIDISHSVGLKYFWCAKVNTADSTKLTEIYLAYKCVNDFVKTAPVFTTNATGDYYRSNSTFKYTGTQFTSSGDSTFLATYTTPTTTMNTTIKGSVVYTDMGHFMGHFKNQNQYPGGFFLNTEVAAMMNQKTDLKGIRFIFGYDGTDSNKIKILLTGVDNTGKNMIKNTSTGNYFMMMERAWPPSSY